MKVRNNSCMFASCLPPIVSGAVFLFCVFCIGTMVVKPFNKVTNFRKVVATVQDKRVKDDVYLVYCKDEDNETCIYEVTDSLLKGRFDSSDMFGSIEIGCKYEFEIAGSRVELLSWYPNIYEIERLSE